MKVERLEIKDLLLVELDVYRDERGFFTERFKLSTFAHHGLPTRFVQDNHSRSAPGVLRGLHYQYSPMQGKLVGCTRGRIFDVAVDLRAGSVTFGKHYGVELSDENGLLLWIPPGFAHGFCTMGDDAADVVYKIDAEYNGAAEGGILWSDPELGIDWPVTAPQLSERDRGLPSFAAYRASPVKWG